MLNKEQEFALEIIELITSLFDEESENYRYNLDEIDATAFFTGFVMAFNLIFNRLTDSDHDLIDSSHLINRLVFQYLLENEKEKDE
jgi:hypothetical protein